MVESAQRNIPWFLLGKFIIILVNIILHLLHDPFGLASSAQRKDGHQHPGVSDSVSFLLWKMVILHLQEKHTWKVTAYKLSVMLATAFLIIVTPFHVCKTAGLFLPNAVPPI